MLRLAILFGTVLVSACSISPERMAEADRAVATHRGQVELQPAVEPETVASPLPEHIDAGTGHHLVLLEHGSDALAMRIRMIRSARERIELMNYIFHADEAGRLLLGELVDAARRGVEVRILVDALFSLDDHQLLAGLELLDDNIEVGLYNPLFDRATLGNAGFLGAALCCFRRLNQRLHHKLLAVDSRHALLGGRNTAERYFDMDTRMNFLDMEVLVSGPVVGEMVTDFERFWSYERSRPARHTREVARTLIEQPPERIMLERDGRASFAGQMATDEDWLEQLLAEAGYGVGEVAYFSDPPDKTYRPEAEISTQVLHSLMRQARHRVLIQTPYFVLSPDFEEVLAGLDDEVEVVVSTNSLAATDAYPVYAVSRRQRYRMIDQLGVRLFEVKPFPADLEQLVARYPQLVADKAAGIESPMRGDPAPATRPMPGPRVSVHAKLMVIDDEIAVVTSHNFDPRSQRYNTENGVIVHDAAFAGALTEYIETIAAPGNSWVVDVKPQGPPVIGAINRGMARVSRRLPTLDIWPWYLTENYRQNAADASANPGSQPDHEANEPVGIAPEVVRGQRRIMTALISRMFGFLRPIM